MIFTYILSFFFDLFKDSKDITNRKEINKDICLKETTSTNVAAVREVKAKTTEKMKEADVFHLPYEILFHIYQRSQAMFVCLS